MGNEWADVAAREAVLLDQVGVHCMFESVWSACRSREVLVFEHERCRGVYGEGKREDLEKGLGSGGRGEHGPLEIRPLT